MKRALAVALTIMMMLATVSVLSQGVAASNSYEFVAKWGSSGSGAGQFNGPNGLAIDASGSVFVADMYNGRIQKFTSDGDAITSWGSYDGTPASLAYPAWIAVDGSGNAIVTDPYEGIHAAKKFTSNGEYLTTLTSNLGAPQGIAVDSSGYIYIVEAAFEKVLKFDPAGNPITSWGSFGSGDGQFWIGMGGIAVDPSGNVYVADSGNNRVQKFTSDGVFLGTWGTAGAGDGEFSSPTGIAVDPEGTIYVADYGNNRVQAFDGVGTYLASFGTSGTGDGQFSGPRGIAIDQAGNIYVADSGNNRIQKFAATTDTDLVPPTVVNVFPGGGYYDASFPVGWSTHVNFSEPMNRASAESAFTLSANGIPVAGPFVWLDDDTMVFNTTELLQYSTEYTITIGTGTMDLAGNHLASEFVSTFTTEADPNPPDLTPPSVLSVGPVNGATGVGVGTSMHVNFSEPMDWPSVEGAFVVSADGVLVDGSFSYLARADSTVFFEPTEDLAYSTEYTMTIGTGAMDAAGNHLVEPSATTFTTEAGPSAIELTISCSNMDTGTAMVGETVWFNFTVTNTGEVPLLGISVSDDILGSVSYASGDGNSNGLLDPNEAWLFSAPWTVQSTPDPLVINAVARSSGGVEDSASYSLDVVPDTTAPTIVHFSPSTPLTLYTVGTSIEQRFMAGYTDDVAVTSVTIWFDGVVVTDGWGVYNTNFSHLVQLSAGEHTVDLSVRDYAGNEATVHWEVTVITRASTLNDAQEAVGTVIAEVNAMISGTPTADGVNEARAQVVAIKANITDAYDHGLLTKKEAQSLYSSCDAVMRSLDKSSAYLDQGQTKGAKNALKTASKDLGVLSDKLNLMGA